MKKWAVQSIQVEDHYLALSGIALRRILSAELFQEQLRTSLGNQFPGIPQVCMARWTDLAATLAALDSLEGYMVLGYTPPTKNHPPLLRQTFLAAGRGATQRDASLAAQASAENLARLLSGTLDYIEFSPITDRRELASAVACLQDSQVTEIRRRWEAVRLDQGLLGSAHGFGSELSPSSPTPLEVRHLFPWVPSDDSWWRLATMLMQEEGRAALCAHWAGVPAVPAGPREEAAQALADAESSLESLSGEGYRRHILNEKCQILQREMFRRITLLDRPAVCGGVFLTSSAPPTTALVSVLANSIDDASVGREQNGADLYWRGGASVVDVPASSLLAPLRPSLQSLFGPEEASAFLRTPMPTDVELAGIPTVRSRSAPMLGKPQAGCFLGVNQFRGARREVHLDADQRLRHTYIVGQTGTGKSTLLLHMILHDLREGHGVAVLDPHGTLIEDILQRFPEERKDDLVILDISDVDYPVGFNILRIDEDDSHKYLACRDLLIDELYTYLDQTYDMKATGGPIFESYFRGMLGLLMGVEMPAPSLIPNLLLVRSLFTDSDFRRRMKERTAGKDFMLQEFVREIEKVGGDAALPNMAPYITSKFNRFISDAALRNITCQNRMLDIDRIVNKGKVLLFYLGKGVIGDHAAGLLASQVVSRIRRAVMARGARTNGKRFCLFADEFQIFAGERFAELLAEGRKFGLALTVAHQYASQLPESVLRAVLGNVGTTILFRVGPQDRDFFDPVFSPEFTGRDLVSLPNFRAYIRSFGALGQSPFNLDVSPPPVGADPALEQGLRQFSRERYGRPREVVEAEIAKTHKTFLRGNEE